MSSDKTLAELIAMNTTLSAEEKLAIAMRALWYYSANVYKLDITYLDRNLEMVTSPDNGAVAQNAWITIVGSAVPEEKVN